MYGVVLMILSLIFDSIILLAIGLGLFIDELTFLLIGGKNHKDNYSKTSLLGTLMFMILVFLTEDCILKLLNI